MDQLLFQIYRLSNNHIKVKKMKQIILKALSFALVVCAAVALNAQTITKDKIIYKLNSSTKTATVSGTEYVLEGAVTIPSSITSSGVTYKVTEIGENAFINGMMTSITLPNSVTKIGASAFWQCYDLTSISIPASVTYIGDYAFSSTGLKSVVIPNSVTQLGNYVFGNCTDLKSAVISNSVKTMGDDPLYQCTSLESVTIPSSAKGMEYFCQGCPLKELAYAEGCTSIFGTELTQDVTTVKLPSTATSIEDEAFISYINLVTINIPSSVKSIGASAFQGCENLTQINISEGVTSIGDQAFASSGLTSVKLPNSVTTLGGGVFEWCYKLKSVSLSDKLKSIENYAFYTCTSLTSIVIPNSVTTIGYSAFKDCTSIGTLILPEDAYVDKYFAQGAIIKVLDVPYSVSSKWTGEIVYYDLTIQNLIYRSGYLAEIVGAFYKYPKVEESLFVLDSHYEEFKSIDKYFSYDVRKISEFGRNEIGSVVTSIVGGKLHFESDVPFDNVSYKFQTKDACISEGTATAKDIDVPVDFTLYVTAEATKEGKLTALGTTTLPISHSLTPSADVNGDGKVSISDVTKVVNQILCK